MEKGSGILNLTLFLLTKFHCYFNDIKVIVIKYNRLIIQAWVHYGKKFRCPGLFLSHLSKADSLLLTIKPAPVLRRQ